MGRRSPRGEIKLHEITYINVLKFFGLQGTKPTSDKFNQERELGVGRALGSLLEFTERLSIGASGRAGPGLGWGLGSGRVFPTKSPGQGSAPLPLPVPCFALPLTRGRLCG